MSMPMQFAAPQSNLRCCKLHAARVHMFSELLIFSAAVIFDTRRFWCKKAPKTPLKKVVWLMQQHHAPPEREPG